jgi:hypothetical protein
MHFKRFYAGGSQLSRMAGNVTSVDIIFIRT